VSPKSGGGVAAGLARPAGGGLFLH